MPSNVTVPERLLRLLTYHENAAATVRATIALLQNGSGPTLDQRKDKMLPVSMIARAALATDEKRRAAKRAYQRQGRAIHHKPKKTKTGGHTHKIQQQRQRTEATLGLFDTRDPKLSGEFRKDQIRGLGVLVTRGYLKKVEGGYLRTAKPFSVRP